jgi:hypothetical protein
MEPPGRAAVQIEAILILVVQPDDSTAFIDRCSGRDFRRTSPHPHPASSYSRLAGRLLGRNSSQVPLFLIADILKMRLQTASPNVPCTISPSLLTQIQPNNLPFNYILHKFGEALNKTPIRYTQSLKKIISPFDDL